MIMIRPPTILTTLPCAVARIAKPSTPSEVTRLAEGGARPTHIGPTTVTVLPRLLPEGQNAFGFRVETTITSASPTGKQRRKVLYLDDYGFVAGRAEVSLNDIRASRPPPTALERHLLTLLYSRAQVHKPNRANFARATSAPSALPARLRRADAAATPPPAKESAGWIVYDSCMADLEETPDGTNSRAAGSLRETLAPWVVALVASGAFVLFVEFNKTKPDHHTIGAKIGAGVLI